MPVVNTIAPVEAVCEPFMEGMLGSLGVVGVSSSGLIPTPPENVK